MVSISLSPCVQRKMVLGGYLYQAIKIKLIFNYYAQYVIKLEVCLGIKANHFDFMFPNILVEI